MTELLGNSLLQGELVYLTAITKEAVEKLYPFTSTVEYIRLSGNGVAFLRGVDKQWGAIDSARKEREGYTFGIYTRQGDSLVGMGGIQSINWQMRNGQLTIGIPNPAERGKGYGGDAVRVLLRYAFWELNLGRAWLHVAAYNSAAIACFQKVGFQLEATLREAVYRDLQYHDMQVMGILYEEWQEHNDGE